MPIVNPSSLSVGDLVIVDNRNSIPRTLQRYIGCIGVVILRHTEQEIMVSFDPNEPSVYFFVDELSIITEPEDYEITL